MSRRDIIIIAVLANAGLLAILFMMAIKSDDDKISEPSEIQQTVVDIKPLDIPLEMKEIPADDGDAGLKELVENSSTPQPIILEDEPVQDLEQEDEIFVKPEPEVIVESPKASPKFIEIKVKRGDSLDKIARANGTTVKAIKEANHLKSDRLDIGQVLRIPTSTDKKPTASKTSSKTTETKQVVAQGDSEYYTVKNGDNPWKIAKQFHVKVDDLLKLNNLNEEKARNLKAGDKIRVR